MAFSRAQRKSLLIGVGLIFAAATLVELIWLGAYLPGFVGELFLLVRGLMWTPLVLDFSIFLFGVILILWLNYFVRLKDGDEYVYLEQVEGPDLPADLPAEARSAVFPEEPVQQGLAPVLAAIEGALDLEDYSEATTLLLALPPKELDSPDVLALRISLAERQGHDEKAAELRKELALKSPSSPRPPQ